jgi:hypothetical protein
MTIDDVMALAYDLADDNCRVLQPESVSQREDALRAAILALLDAEAEACAELAAPDPHAPWSERCDCRDHIRARIAARKNAGAS